MFCLLSLLSALCDLFALLAIRFVRRRIYIERNGTRGGCFTLTQIWESGKRPLYPVDPVNNSRECERRRWLRHHVSHSPCQSVSHHAIILVSFIIQALSPVHPSRDTLLYEYCLRTFIIQALSPVHHFLHAAL